jgi:RNA polymerase sigma-70 factor (ECF subfamily)
MQKWKFKENKLNLTVQTPHAYRLTLPHIFIFLTGRVMVRSQLNDSVLIELYISGDEKCLEELINRHKRQIFSFIIKHVKDRALAEDIFQDSFIRVIRTLKSDNYQEEGKFLPWVMRIAHNLVHDHFRANKRKKSVSVDNADYDFFERFVSPDSTAQERIQHLQLQKDIRKWVNQLPFEIKQVVIMRTFLDLSFKEIAEITNVPINTALGRMRNGVIKLRKMYQNEECKAGGELILNASQY